MHAATRIIREEHAALAAMLRSIILLLDQHRRERSQPDFRALRAMLFYVDEFPEQRHHRKETELLFPKLRARTPLSRKQLDRLDADHARGEHQIRELEHALLAFEMLGDSRRAAFEQAAQRYVDFYLTHMALEEREILPLAERHVTVAEWNSLGEQGIDEMDQKQLPIIFGAILEECTPDERRAMLAKLPLPVRLVLRTVGALQYRRYVTRVRGR